MTDHTTRRRPFAALALAATLICGAGAASATTVQVTLDFGTNVVAPASPYVEDGFEVSGNSLLLGSAGNPKSAIVLDQSTPSLMLRRVGGGAFSLISFDYSCAGSCNFSVGTLPITQGSATIFDFATASPIGFSGVGSLEFKWASSAHYIDNIVLSYEQAAPVPLPAGLPLLLSGLAGLWLMARRKGRAA